MTIRRIPNGLRTHPGAVPDDLLTTLVPDLFIEHIRYAEAPCGTIHFHEQQTEIRLNLCTKRFPREICL